MLATLTPIFTSLAAVEEVNQEMAVKQKSAAAHEIMVKEGVPVQLAEMVDSCWVPFEEMPTLTPAQ